MIPKKFSVNNYVYFRYKEEWIECRIKEIITTPKKNTQSFIIYIPKYNIIHPEAITEDMIHTSCLENMKKLKIFYQSVELPPFFINFLHEDRLKIRNNLVVKLPSNCPVKNIVDDFAQYINENKIIYEDELEEMVAGFKHCFDNLMNNYLLYDKEILQYDKFLMTESKPCEVYGIEHFIRMMYYCKLTVRCEVFLEYMFYMCDFLDMNYKKYFIEREYEEFK